MNRPYSLLLALVAAFTFGTALAQGMRAEIGKPLQQAGEYIKAGKGKEALAKVREAEAVPNRSPSEQLLIDRMKAAAAQRAGDMATAVQALEAIHPKTSGAEAGQIAEQIASAYAQLKNVSKASEWVAKAQQAGHNTATLKQLQSYLQGASGDYAAIARDAAAAGLPERSGLGRCTRRVCGRGEAVGVELVLGQLALANEIAARRVHHDRHAAGVHLVTREVREVLHYRMVHEARAPAPGVLGQGVGHHRHILQHSALGP
jgi:hypothetical protein